MRKQGWTYKKLGEICDTINGLWKGKKPPFVRVGVIRNANFTKEFTLRFDNVEFLDVEERQFTKRKLQKGDLIVEKSGGSTKQPVGRAVLFEKEDGDFSFSNFTSVLRIKDKKELLYQFLYKYLLFSYKRGDTLTMQKATTGIHNIEFDKFLGIDIPVPSMEEQERIVARLDAAFAQIDELRANAEKQLEEARALFNAALNEEMKPKKGWEEKTLGEVLTKISDGSHNPPKGINYSDYPMLSSKNVFFDSYNYNSPRYLSKADFELENRRTQISDGDVLLTIVGTVGRTCCVQKPFIPFTLQRSVAVLKPKHDLIVSRFLMYTLHSLSELWNQEAKGAAQKGIYLKQLSLIPIFAPSLSEQEAIVERLDGLSERVKKLEEIARTTVKECDALKQSILRETFE